MCFVVFGISGLRRAWLCFALALVVLATFPEGVNSQGEISDLQPKDCALCHRLQTERIAEFGGRHAAVVTCLECHPHHPPLEGASIVSCVSCHGGKPHYQVGNCLHCHADPHQPLILQAPLKPARQSCLSCHAEVGQAMAGDPSLHARLFCNRCHQTHKEIPTCIECHSPHLQTQTNTDCRRCHAAHQPLNIAPTGYVPASQCQVCHRKAAADLARTSTDHGVIGCSYCHSGQHPFVPNCQDCHGLPHGQVMHSQFRDCLQCHGDAHNLINQR